LSLEVIADTGNIVDTVGRRRLVFAIWRYATQTDTVIFSSTSCTHRLWHRGIHVIQKVGVPVMKTARNRSVSGQWWCGSS